MILLYYWNKKRLIITSSFDDIVKNISDLRINLGFILHFLHGTLHVIGTIYQNVNWLHPCFKYVFSNSNLKIYKKDIVAKQIFIENISYKNLYHLNEYNVVAAEISGGLNSTFLPILSKKSSYFPFVLAVGQQHTGSVGETQLYTLNGLKNFLHIPFEYALLT